MRDFLVQAHLVVNSILSEKMVPVRPKLESIAQHANNYRANVPTLDVVRSRGYQTRRSHAGSVGDELNCRTWRSLQRCQSLRSQPLSLAVKKYSMSCGEDEIEVTIVQDGDTLWKACRLRSTAPESPVRYHRAQSEALRPSLHGA